MSNNRIWTYADGARRPAVRTAGQAGAAEGCGCPDAVETAAPADTAEIACPCSCTRTVSFCETLTLHESFDPAGICSANTGIAYDVSFLGYTMEEVTMDAQLPGGGCCPVLVRRISLTGAIPYVVSVGTVSSGCGSPVHLSVEGSTMVDTLVGNVCCGSDIELEALACCNVTPEIEVSTTPCGNSGKTNVTIHGTFTFSNLPIAFPVQG